MLTPIQPLAPKSQSPAPLPVLENTRRTSASSSEKPKDAPKRPSPAQIYLASLQNRTKKSNHLEFRRKKVMSLKVKKIRKFVLGLAQQNDFSMSNQQFQEHLQSIVKQSSRDEQLIQQSCIANKIRAFWATRQSPAPVAYKRMRREGEFEAERVGLAKTSALSV